MKLIDLNQVKEKTKETSSYQTVVTTSKQLALSTGAQDMIKQLLLENLHNQHFGLEDRQELDTLTQYIAMLEQYYIKGIS